MLIFKEKCVFIHIPQKSCLKHWVGVKRLATERGQAFWQRKKSQIKFYRAAFMSSSAFALSYSSAPSGLPESSRHFSLFHLTRPFLIYPSTPTQTQRKEQFV
jgi:hypothetical protein